jgi:hypothetical protein
MATVVLQIPSRASILRVFLSRAMFPNLTDVQVRAYGGSDRSALSLLGCIVSLFASSQLTAANANWTAHHHPIFGPLASTECITIADFPGNVDDRAPIGDGGFFFWSQRSRSGSDRGVAITRAKGHLRLRRQVTFWHVDHETFGVWVFRDEDF